VGRRQTEFSRDIANIPIAVALVAIDQSALNDVKRTKGERGVWKKPFRIALIGEAQDQFLRVVRLPVQQRANFWASKPSLSHVLLGKISAM
jgi:hypothetical protein